MNRIDPLELWNPCTPSESDPYLALWAAVFSLAVRDVVGPAYLLADGECAQYARRAPRWMNDDETTTPGSFLWLCATFDLVPAVVRRGVEARVRERHREKEARRAGG